MLRINHLLTLPLLFGLIEALVFPRASAAYSPSYSSLGCYTDSPSRTLTGRSFVNYPNNTRDFCINACGLIGYTYAGTEYSSQCFCGNSIVNGGAPASSNSCNAPCNGNSSQTCGGTYFMNLYRISNPQPSNNNSVFPLDCTNQPLKSEPVCDTTKSYAVRAASLVSLMTLDEKVNNLVSTSYGALRVGLLPYEWWNEALHGVADSPGVLFANNGSTFSYATSFPETINLGATFDDALVANIAKVIGREARAFANAGHSGFDFWTPNINPFRDPRWGRGMETPGEDAFHIQSYVAQLIPGLQQRSDASQQVQIIATCKHYAVYDIETNRYSNNLDPTQQDLGEYYLAPFKTCVRDAGAISVMCSYNAVDGVPACANQYLLQDLLRGSYLNFTSPYNYVTSDCDAISDVSQSHHFTNDLASGSAVSLNAGTDLDCGTTYKSLSTAVANKWTSEAKVNSALTRLYTALFAIGAFDGKSPFNTLAWSDVNTANARALSYQSSMESLVLLKNDGTLPLKSSIKKIALIGPMASATSQLQGNYFGNAPYLTSPLSAFSSKYNVTYAQGTGVNSDDTSGFAAAISAAKQADAVIFIGGIDTTIEAEGMDRTSITWPGNQLQLISNLAQVGKPLVVVQWGGGQLDDSQLLSNPNVNSIVWAGYPGQDGGTGLRDVLTGVWSIAGRLPVTQYSAAFTSQVSMYQMDLRPSGSYPGRTYKWYTGKPVLPFGYGLHYTNFTFAWNSKPTSSYSIQTLVSQAAGAYVDISPFITVTATVKNTGGPANMFSDYTGLLFLSTANAGPSPYPNKWLVSYNRAHNIQVGSSATLTFNISLGSLARADTDGSLWLYPGTYKLTLDNQPALSTTFNLTGQATRILQLPAPKASYSYTVPVYPQGPTT